MLRLHRTRPNGQQARVSRRDELSRRLLLLAPLCLGCGIVLHFLAQQELELLLPFRPCLFPAVSGIAHGTPRQHEGRQVVPRLLRRTCTLQP